MAFYLFSSALLCQDIFSNDAELKKALQPEPVRGIDEGRHLIQDTPLGTISIGVSGSTISEESRSGTADLELGYVYEFKNEGMIPFLLLVQPFLLDRVEQNGEDFNTNAGFGGGLKISNKPKDDGLKWTFRFAAVSKEDPLDSNPQHRAEAELLAGLTVTVPWGKVPRQDRGLFERLKPAKSLLTFNISPAIYRAREKLKADQIKLIHSLLLASYFGEVLKFESIKLEEPIHYRETVADEIIYYLKQRKLFSSPILPFEEDILLERDGSYPEEQNAILLKYLKPWITKKLRDEYPLMFQVADKDMLRIWELFPGKVVSVNPQPELFNDDQMVMDFIEGLRKSLKYPNSQLQKMRLKPIR